MKKLIALFLSVVLCIACLVSCDSNDEKQQHYDDISKISGLTRGDYENYTIFRFDNFQGSAILKMNRVGFDNGKIYYQYSLSEGSVFVNIDRGIYDSEESLLFAVAGCTIPDNSSTNFDIPGNEIAVIFRTKGINAIEYGPVSGEIIISFLPLV